MVFVVMMQASEVLPEISSGSFEASKSILAMRRSASDSHPFLSRSVPHDEEELGTPRATEVLAAAATGNGSPQIATSPFQAVALGPQALASNDPRIATPDSAPTAADVTGTDTAPAAGEHAPPAAGDMAAESKAAAAAQAEQPAMDKGAAGDAAAAATAAEAKLRPPALAARQSSGADASNARTGSLDLGMLPPREMQVLALCFSLSFFPQTPSHSLLSTKAAFFCLGSVQML